MLNKQITEEFLNKNKEDLIKQLNFQNIKC